MKITSHSWYPDVAVAVVSHPPAVRPQGIVKNLNAYSVPVVVVVITVIIVIIVVITVIPVVTVLRISPALKSHTGCKQCCCKGDQDGVY
jgi:antibiotic biosynthesis monooxygenase (ABM) superfamily enzyme